MLHANSSVEGKALGNYTRCEDGENTTHCSSQYNFIEDLVLHSCDHCSYLGLNPCGPGVSPECQEPKDLPGGTKGAPARPVDNDNNIGDQVLQLREETLEGRALYV